jgi:hypothetical protein
MLAVEPFSPHGWAALAAAELAEDDDIGARRDASRALDLLEDYPLAIKVRSAAEQKQGDLAAAHADRDRLNALAEGPETDPTARAARLLKQAEN